MFPVILLVDFLIPDGTLTSYVVRPRAYGFSLVVDRLRDIYRQPFGGNDIDVGGTRIYNASECSIVRATARIRSFRLSESEKCFSFEFEHRRVPIGGRQGAGRYNLVLSPGFRLRDVAVVDLHGDVDPSAHEKRRFEYQVTWDPECSTQMVEMDLDAPRGSCSVRVTGAASLVAVDGDAVKYVDAAEIPSGVSCLDDAPAIDEDGGRRLAEDLARKADWLELKPNIFGLGINVNRIIGDSIRHFQRKTGSR